MAEGKVLILVVGNDREEEKLIEELIRNAGAGAEVVLAREEVFGASDFRELKPRLEPPGPPLPEGAGRRKRKWPRERKWLQAKRGHETIRNGKRKGRRRVCAIF